MGQQCSGADRDEYIRHEEEMRARELENRPIVMQQGPEGPVFQAKPIAHPTVQHRKDPLMWNAPTSAGIHPSERPRPPPGVFGYADEQEIYHSEERSGDGPAPLTNASGAFTDPRMVDRFYDVSVSHVILAATETPTGLPPSDRSSYSGSFRSGGSAPPPPAWQPLQAIPFPMSGNTLPPLPYAHGIHNSLTHPEGLPDVPQHEIDPAAAMPSLKWKPKFSKAVSSLTSEPISPSEKAARKQARAARRQEREEQERAAQQAMRDLHLQQHGARNASRLPRKSFSQNETAVPSSRQSGEYLSFSYMRDEEEEDEEEEEKVMTPQVPQTPVEPLRTQSSTPPSAPVIISRSQPTPPVGVAQTPSNAETVTGSRIVAATPNVTAPPVVSNHDGGALSHFFASEETYDSDSDSTQPIAIATSTPAVVGSRSIGRPGSSSNHPPESKDFASFLSYNQSPSSIPVRVLPQVQRAHAPVTQSSSANSTTPKYAYTKNATSFEEDEELFRD